MKILRSMEDFDGYLKEALGSVFDEGLKQEIVRFVSYNDGGKQVLKKIKEGLGEPLPKEIAEFGECIFQLQNYRETLKNYVEVLLAAGAYEQLVQFVNRIFVPHIGNVHYKSEGEYTLEQRYFDRFVEIIQYCDVDRELLLPFFVEIFESDGRNGLFNFKAPLSEYVKIFAKQTEGDIFKYFDVTKNLQGIDYFLSIDKFRTINAVIEGFILQKTNMAVEVKNFIVHHKTEALEILERHLGDSDLGRVFRVLVLLSCFKGDAVADSLIVGVYQKTHDKKVKAFIEKELNFENAKEFSSRAEFFDEVERSVDKIQQRLYGIRLNRYFEEENIENNKVATYIFESFKSMEREALLKFVGARFKFVDETVRNALARIVYKTATERRTLESSKWALRLIAVLGSAEMLDSMVDFIGSLDKTNKKVSEYFVLCVVLSLRADAVAFIKKLKARFEGGRHKYLDKMLEIYSANSGRNIEEIFDELTDDLGLVHGQRMFDLGRRKLKVVIIKNKVAVLNEAGKPARIAEGLVCEGVKIKKYVAELQKQVNLLNKRFYHTFLNSRIYQKPRFFDLIVSHNLLGVLAEGFLWGKYKNGRLFEAFKLEKGQMLHISGTYLNDSEDFYVAMVSPLDVDTERLKGQVGWLSMNQLGFPKFNVTQPNAVWADNFAGMFVNAHMFITRLQKLTYKMNGKAQDMYNTLVKANKNTNLLTEVEFDSIRLGGEKNYTTTISKIRFYKLDSLLMDGKNYIINRAEALPLGSVDERIFSNEMALIFMAAHR